MLWRRRKPTWPIDPSKVAFGAVVENGGRNLSRTHVKVKYRQASKPQFVPLVEFIRHCQKVIRDGGSLEIEHLLVAPILQRRYARFFNRLTDWGPAARRAYRPRSGRPMLHDR